MRKSLYFFIIFYFFILLSLYLLQNSLLYFPDTNSEINKKFWTPISINNDDKFIAIRSNTNFKKNVIIFHGNAGNASIRTYFQKIFYDSNIIIAEYPGFGFRYNEDLSKENILNSGSDLINFIKKENKEIILVGESLGTGVASELAYKNKISKLILFTPYDSILNIAKDQFKFFPISLLLKDNYDNVENLKNFHDDLIIVIAKNDNVINSKYSQNLISSVKNNKLKLIYLEGSQHNDYVNYLDNNHLFVLNNFE
jgi:esterase/lipase